MMPTRDEINSTINEWVRNALKFGNLYAVAEVYAEIISAARTTTYVACEDYESSWMEATIDSSKNKE